MTVTQVMPIVDRGLRQRSSDMKRRAVQIVGNMWAQLIIADIFDS